MNGRREHRFGFQLTVSVRQGARTQRLLTENVSYRGLFLRTDSPPPLRQLVKLDAVLPPHDVPFQSHGMSVFVIRPDDPSGRTPGAGIQFYGMGDERRHWEAFVHHARRAPTAPDEAASALPSGEPVRRRFERMPLVLEVKPTTVDELMLMWTRDVSAGGMFLATEAAFAVGAELRLDVKHPATGATFPLAAVVRRHGDGDQPGLGLELVAMSDSRRRDFFAFITSTIPSVTPEELGLLVVK